MFTQEMTVVYRDGRTETVVASQADIKAFELWALQRGIYARPGGTLMQDAPILFMRVAAWSATFRASGQRIDFDTWDNTVTDVEPKGDAAVADPFPEPTPGGESEF